MPANCSREDCFHLSHGLPDSTELRRKVDSAALEDVFREFASKRSSRTASLVKGARANGERRVVTGGREACDLRDRDISLAWSDSEVLAAKYDSLFREPFT